MILECQPNLWTCLPTSLSMVIQNKIDSKHNLQMIVEFLKHDGGLVVDKDKGIPYGCIGITLRELVDYCYYKYSRLLAHIPAHVYVVGDIVKNDEFKDYLDNFDAVIVGTIFGKQHAVAWDCNEQMVYDPTGTRYPLSCDVDIDGLLILSK